MKFTKTDFQRVNNLIIALRKAKFDDMIGEECLAFAQTFQWVNALAAYIQKEVSTPEPIVNPQITMPSQPQTENPSEQKGQEGNSSKKVVQIKDRNKSKEKK